MDRRIVASGLAVAAGVSIVAAQAAVGVPDFASWQEVVPSVGALVVAVAVPLVGAVLVMRRRPGGVAVLVTAALLGLPAIPSLASLVVTSPPVGDGNAYLFWQLVAQLAIVGSGIAAWGLRDAERWRWDRAVLLPFVALAVVVVLPIGALLVTEHGALFPIAMLATMSLFDLAWLAQLVVIVGLLTWAARLPRRTAAVVLLVVLVPRMFSSLDRLVHSDSFGTMTTDPFTALGLVAVAALVATACWWLTRGDDLPTHTDAVEQGTPSTPR